MYSFSMLAWKVKAFSYTEVCTQTEVILDNLRPWEVIWVDFKHCLSIFKSTVQYISLALQRPGRKDAECELEESIGGRGAEGWRGLA